MTKANDEKIITNNISIHTLVKRVTIIIFIVFSQIMNFNSHSRKESDYFEDVQHTALYYFNSHSRKESDKGIPFEILKGEYFNSHSRKESDIIIIQFNIIIIYFNSHSRKESDTTYIKLLSTICIFQFTLS